MKAAGAHALGANHPEEAAGWLAQLSPENLNPDLLDWAAVAWAEKDLAAVCDWIGSQPDPDVQERLLSRALVGLARNDPVAAMDFAVKQMEPHDGSLRPAVETIMGELASHDPESAKAWIAQMPPGDLREAALAALADAWSDRQPAEAQTWVLSRPPGTGRDESLQQLACRKSQDAPAEAMIQAAHISDPRIRDTVGASLVRKWARDDFSAANSWVENLEPGAFQQAVCIGLGAGRAESLAALPY